MKISGNFEELYNLLVEKLKSNRVFVKKITTVYGNVADLENLSANKQEIFIDFSEHDRTFVEKNEELKFRISCLEKDFKTASEKGIDLAGENIKLQAECNEFKVKSEELERIVKELESELSIKENLLKIKNGLAGEKENEWQLPVEPVDVASMLINAREEYETNSLQRAFGAGEKEVADKYSVDDLRQIAEHLLVYCNHNSEETEQ